MEFLHVLNSIKKLIFIVLNSLSMTDPELEKLYNRYKKDSIVSALYKEFLEISASFDQITLLANQNPQQYLKIKEDSKIIKKKIISVSLSRFAEIEVKRKINTYSTVVLAFSILCAACSIFQNYRQQSSSAKIKIELFEALSDQMEQSSQEMFDKIQKKSNKNNDEKLDKMPNPSKSNDNDVEKEK
jgi:hypothetical protein